jgi:hypothetical protein
LCGAGIAEGVGGVAGWGWRKQATSVCHCEEPQATWQSHWLSSKYQNPISKQTLQNVKPKVQNDRANVKDLHFKLSF